FFGPGETRKEFTVLVNGDRVGEPNEVFVVDLSGATNAFIASKGQGVGTILDDEPWVSISDVSKKEGNDVTKKEGDGKKRTLNGATFIRQNLTLRSDANNSSRRAKRPALSIRDRGPNHQSRRLTRLPPCQTSRGR